MPTGFAAPVAPASRLPPGLLYVYGLLAAGGLGQPGDPDRTSDGGLGAGVGGEPALLVDCGALAALASAIPPGPVAQTRRNMVAHTAVLERAMAAATVLPMRFGTVAPDEAALRRCVAGNLDALLSALAGIAGRVELGVKASWREGVVYAEIVASDPGLRQLRDRLRSRPADQTYHERVELGRRVEAALAVRRAEDAAAIAGPLSRLAERELDLRALSDDMVLNRAFLVRRADEARFDAQMQALAERHAARLELRYVGPAPPYNFVHLHAGWLAEAA